MPHKTGRAVDSQYVLHQVKRLIFSWSDDMVTLVFAVIFIADALTVPALIWAWVRWIRQPQDRNLLSYLASTALVLATASAVLAASAFIYAAVIGGFPFYDRRLLRIYSVGLLLSLSGTIIGVAGSWKRGPIRWLAPACAFGTLLYWFGAASSE
jgi:hypothetical protein